MNLENLCSAGAIIVRILYTYILHFHAHSLLLIGIPKQKDVAIYTLCANRQRPLAGAMHNAVFNTARRVRGQFLYVAPPFVIAYLLLSWAEEKYAISSLPAQWVDFIKLRIKS
jgi:ubiquinol-cytochrome c reductase subunit 8